MTAALTISKKYKASPTLAKFHHDVESMVRGIRGPVGSGKSVGCVLEIVLRSICQAAAPDGVRRTRWAIVRNTYPELKSTTIKTWQDWVPAEVCKIKYDAPINGVMKFNLADGTRVEAEVIFMPLDTAKDVKKLLSFELTGAWVNEAREIPREIIDGLTQRIGRYPGKSYGAPLTWTGIIMDTNPPDDMHWWAEFEKNPPRKWKFYQQPSGLIKLPPKRKGEKPTYVPNPKAENMTNHQKGFDYYLDMLEGKTEAWIRVYILNEFGLLINGKAVFGDHFSETRHRSPTKFLPIRGLDIYLGWDFGLTPACVICQVTPQGRVRILEELTTERMGVLSFATEVVKPLLTSKYKGCNIISVGDPAGVARSTTDEKTCFEILDEAGIYTEPVDSNDLTARLEAVRYFLWRTMGANPMLQISPDCEMILKGMAGGYHYERVSAPGGGGRLKVTPAKNIFSHVMDALQYVLMEIKRNNDLR
jgi:hypothetical protein